MDERRTGWLLIFLLMAQLLLLASQLPAAGGGKSRLEAGALRTLAPIARLVNGIVGAGHSTTEWFRGRESLRRENTLLLEANRSMSLELLHLQELAGQVERLSEAVDYEPPDRGTLRVADVLYIDHSSWIRTLVVYAPKGELMPNQAVLTSEGLVGRVVLVAGDYAKIQLITDRAAGVGAMVQRTRRQGLVQGTSRGGLQLTYLPRQSDVRIGDRVVTSGIDGIFPRGILIGVVVSVETGTDLFQEIRLTSAVDFGRLDHVYMLSRASVPEEILEALPGGQ